MLLMRERWGENKRDVQVKGGQKETDNGKCIYTDTEGDRESV